MEDLYRLLEPRYKRLADEILADGPLLFDEFRVQMHSALDRYNREEVKEILTKWYGKDASTLQDTEIGAPLWAQSTGEILDVIAENTPRDFSTRLLIAELQRRHRSAFAEREHPLTAITGEAKEVDLGVNQTPTNTTSKEPSSSAEGGVT